MAQEVLPDLPSDHRPILLSLDTSPSSAPKRRTRRKTDWEAFSAFLENPLIGPVSTAEEVEAAATAITNSIQAALETSSRIIPAGERYKPLPTHPLPNPEDGAQPVRGARQGRAQEP